MEMLSCMQIRKLKSPGYISRHNKYEQGINGMVWTRSEKDYDKTQ